MMIWNYLRFDFGESYFRSRSVVELVLEKMPVSISLGIWTTLLTYLIAIPLGIRKAVRDGTPFDVWTSAVIIVGYAMPSFLFGHPADRAVRRWQLLAAVSVARAGVGQFLARCPGMPGAGLSLAHGPADRRR